jgi:hypothetical protein
MMPYDENIYYHPEKSGLEVFASVDVPFSYEFDCFVIWKHEDLGYFTWGSDSGCSCPTPFESHDPKDMPQGHLFEAMEDMKSWALEGYGYKPGDEVTNTHSRAYLARQEFIKLGMQW